ncbi:MAG: MBL fold metallo-hydrolase [Bacteroidetes bacterium]|nr:MBL fold metallo-hydrolase [Bacteroidota bacterium]
MTYIKTFHFNPFQVNTYVIYDETGECAIIDPACYTESEEKIFKDFILQNNLKPVLQLYTHCHIDHVLGTNFISKTFGLKPITHQDSAIFIDNAKSYGASFGFEINDLVKPEKWILDNEELKFGNQSFKAIHTPGHAAGSICFYNEAEKTLFSGDVLFQGSIGRTDLPTGDYDTLIKSIINKLLILPDDVTVYPGHGDKTSIKYERVNNPFLNGIY